MADYADFFPPPSEEEVRDRCVVMNWNRAIGQAAEIAENQWRATERVGLQLFQSICKRHSRRIAREIRKLLIDKRKE